MEQRKFGLQWAQKNPCEDVKAQYFPKGDSKLSDSEQFDEKKEVENLPCFGCPKDQEIVESLLKMWAWSGYTFGKKYISLCKPKCKYVLRLDNAALEVVNIVLQCVLLVAA